MPRHPQAPHRRHPALPHLAAAHRRGQIDRREFLARATALGIGAAAARQLAGIAPAQAAAPDRRIAPGGTLRIQQSVRALDEPRRYDWSEMGNQTRGFLEYLVEYRHDGSFGGMLLRDWEVGPDATRYRLHLRPGVRWNNGDAFTARDVARNITAWCDSTVPGNSMATRFPGLIDPATGRARDGAVVIDDPLTVTLHLSQPDIALIASMSDYPAAITHRSYDGGDPFAHGIGTGPFRPVTLEPGRLCVLERHPEHRWWGTAVFGGPWLDRVEFHDLGTDPLTWAKAAEAGEIDLLYDSVGAFIKRMDAIGWTRTRTRSAATLVVRAHQRVQVGGRTPYAATPVRRALALAVDNAICLELGHRGRGEVAANHHVSPLHPAHADIGPPEFDPAGARRMMAAAGMADFTHELVTLDDEWQRNTGDAVTAMLADAGIPVARRILPGAEFWTNWRSYPFSATEWNHRPLAVQIMNLAYRSDSPWNETGFADPEFDALVARASGQTDTMARRETMRALETRMREAGVIIQPYWRALFNHHNGRLVNAARHPANEIHLHYIGFAADG